MKYYQCIWDQREFIHFFYQHSASGITVIQELKSFVSIFNIIFFLVVPQIHSSKLLSQADIFLAAETCWISKYWCRLACWQCFKQQERLLSLSQLPPSYHGSIQSRHFSNSTIDWGKLLKFVPLHTCFCKFLKKMLLGALEIVPMINKFL